MTVKFKECPTCAAKIGAQLMCQSCCINRSNISRLQDELKEAIAQNNKLRSLQLRYMDTIEFLLNYDRH